MASTKPYDQLVGTLTFYLAPVGTAEPAVDTTPASPWVELGCTEGDQVISEEGDLTAFYDNCHQGPVKFVRPQEDPVIKGRLVSLTLANVARLVSSTGTSAIVADAGPPSVQRLALKKGFFPSEYALLLKGAKDSPVGDYPAQHYLPRGVFTGKFVRTRSKTARDFIDFEYKVAEDDTQSDANRLGWVTVQVS